MFVGPGLKKIFSNSRATSSNVRDESDILESLELEETSRETASLFPVPSAMFF